MAEVIRVHLRDLCRVAHELGVPRERLFTHAGGWQKGERLYASAVNAFSCPGWSFYRYGRDPRGDTTAMAAVAASDAPYWAAVEWLPLGVRTQHDWENAFAATLSIPRCRYLSIFNWQSIAERTNAKSAITAVLQAGA